LTAGLATILADQAEARRGRRRRGRGGRCRGTCTYLNAYSAAATTTDTLFGGFALKEDTATNFQNDTPVKIKSMWSGLTSTSTYYMAEQVGTTTFTYTQLGTRALRVRTKTNSAGVSKVRGYGGASLAGTNNATLIGKKYCLMVSTAGTFATATSTGECGTVALNTTTTKKLGLIIYCGENPTDTTKCTTTVTPSVLTLGSTSTATTFGGLGASTSTNSTSTRFGRRGGRGGRRGRFGRRGRGLHARRGHLAERRQERREHRRERREDRREGGFEHGHRDEAMFDQV
jgi:hypothetical protein